MAQGLCNGTALPLDPIGSWPAPLNVRRKCGLDTVGPAEDIRQHEGVLHRHATAFAHVRRARMRGIPDQDDSTPVPFAELDIFNRSKVELLIGLQGGKIRWHRRAESGKAAPKAIEAP